MPPLIAYSLYDQPGLRLVTADQHRDWMSETPAHFANRCLPLLLANQYGWLILNRYQLTFTWHNDEYRGVEVSGTGGASSHFGSGIVTWHIPYVFRTPPGYNLVVRGPTNSPKPGIVPLDGIVETDWATAPFTMNWRMTEKERPVTFEADEPICMIYPVRRDDLESFDPVILPLSADPAVQASYEAWSRSRTTMLGDQTRSPAAWEKHYFQGRTRDEQPAPEHQTKLRLREFR